MGNGEGPLLLNLFCMAESFHMGRWGCWLLCLRLRFIFFFCRKEEKAACTDQSLSDRHEKLRKEIKEQ